MPGARAVARRAFADGRVRTFSFAALFGFASLLQAVAYRSAYPTLEDRIRFAASVGQNDAARLLYGQPHELLTVGGYLSWRMGGGLAIFAGVWGVLAAVRAMRAEEDAGRADLVQAGVVGRWRVFLAQLAAIAAGVLVLWLALFVAFVAGRLPVGGAAYLALAIVSVIPVFVGVGAVASQLAPTRRLATVLSTGVLVVALALRTIAATAESAHRLVWATPLGWAGELRPFSDTQPLVLVLPAVTSALLLVSAAALLVRRDVGRGLLPSRDTAPARLRLLGSPIAQAFRSGCGLLLAWLVGVGAFAALMGFISGVATPDVISDELREQLRKLGIESVATPAGWLGFTFVFLVLAVSMFCCMQIGAIRSEEAQERLDTLLALPVGRHSWLAGRLVLAAAEASIVALAAGALAWLGAVVQGADVSLPALIGAGANCLPVSVLFLSLGALAFAVAPRPSPAIAYGLVAVAFLWELLGALLEAPDWLLALSPFHDMRLVPAESFEPGWPIAMLGLAALSAIAALGFFGRRDLAGA